MKFWFDLFSIELKFYEVLFFICFGLFVFIILNECYFCNILLLCFYSVFVRMLFCVVGIKFRVYFKLNVMLWRCFVMLKVLMFWLLVRVQLKLCIKFVSIRCIVVLFRLKVGYICWLMLNGISLYELNVVNGFMLWWWLRNWVGLNLFGCLYMVGLWWMVKMFRMIFVFVGILYLRVLIGFVDFCGFFSGLMGWR